MISLAQPVTLGGVVAALLMALLRVCWMVYQGKLIPKSSVDRLEADRDHWRNATEALVPAVAAIAEQQRAMMAGMGIVREVTGAIQREAAKPMDSA